MNRSVNSAEFSVLMSIYRNDRDDFLSKALVSIYFDQLVKPQQIVLVGDGPLRDEQLKIINNFKDDVGERCVDFFQLDENVGLAAALNYGLTFCRYDLVARMDADDISLPERFKVQYNFLMQNLNIIVCGSSVNEIDSETEVVTSTRRVPISHKDIMKFAKLRSPINHPSVMFRKNFILEAGGYPLFRKSQDYALWSKLLINGHQFANLDSLLLNMRTGNELYNRRGLEYLRYEYQVMSFQYKIGFINYFEFIKNVFIRTIFRVMPLRVRKYLYSYVRSVVE